VIWRVRAFWLYGIVAATAAGQAGPGALPRREAYQRVRALAELGKKMFFDPALSGSGKISCASCHDPAYAYAPANGLPVQRGGKDMQQWGRRATPSLKYLQIVPSFTEHYFDSEISGDDSIDGGPTGGLTWDGRVDRGRAQARIPLLSPYEMANDGPTQVAASVLKSSYAAEVKRLAASSSVNAVFDATLEALEAWQQEYREFYPYSSKYDAWLVGDAQLSETEQRGLQLFNAPDKGDCARCHISARGANGTPPQFTDYALIALGVPRNREIPANSASGWYDLGLCGPERQDLRGRDEYCGRFMTPSLRNVATRKSFFHNGVFHSLKDVVAFYAQRDANPEKWYPVDSTGKAMKFDDLPQKYHGNVESGSPFGRARGGKPPLSDDEIADIVAFLETLTDGFRQLN
jgi:cytochrome c peroxidase